MKSEPKVAIVCDWLLGIGGAERVVLELHHMFPNAPIYTSQYDPNKIDWFKGADVRTGWMQKLPGSFKKFMPVLRAWYFSHLDLSEYDLIISNNFGAESKAIRFGNKTHICICNAPTHYYWSRYDAYLANPGVQPGLNWLARLGLRLLVGPMRRWDYRAAQRPSHIIAISTHIQAEIKKYYGRNSVVVHPPIDTNRFQLASSTSHLPEGRQGFITTGRQTPYKRVDLAVAACTKLGLTLTVIGDGPDHDKLVKLAGPTIKFVTGATDAQVTEQFARAQAFIFPGLDDFGIVPVEAMAAGMPVIAFQGGGALDYVITGKTGEFFTEQSVDNLASCLQAFEAKNYDPRVIKNKAQEFSIEHFQTTLHQTIDSLLTRS